MTTRVGYKRIADLAEQGLGPVSIMGETGLPRPTVVWYLAIWRRELRAAGVALPLCRCGQPSGHKELCSEYESSRRRLPPSDFREVAPTLSLDRLKAHYLAGKPTLRRWFAETGTPLHNPHCRRSGADIRAQVEALAWNGYSCASIKALLSFNPATVHMYFYGMRRRLRAEGLSLPQCLCGQPHNHDGQCIEKPCGGTARKRAVPLDFAKIGPLLSMRQLSVRYRASYKTVLGWFTACPHIERKPNSREVPTDFADQSPNLSVQQLAGHYQASRRTINRWFRDRPGAKRWRRMVRPLAAKGRVSGRVADPLYQEIEQLVPSGLPPDIRDDVISELILAVLDGSLSRDRLQSGGRAIMDRTIDKCGASRWTTHRSLDAPITESGMTLADVIADDRALDAFEALFDEELDDTV